MRMFSSRPSAADADPNPFAGIETILLVDDEPGVRMLIARTLGSHGYRVITATDGEDAIEQAGLHDAPIHLVLTDVVMPEMTGRELFDTLRGWYPAIRVLFMSGYARGEVTEEELNDVHTAFIAKPFLAEALLTAVRSLLDAPRQA
jgi:two-component system cell cycle sensor histidine kinase/response regulator CckA